MNILHIIDGLNAGGKERQFIELLKGLVKKKNIKVAVVILSDNIDYRYIFDCKLGIHTLKRKYKNDFSIFKKLYKICKDFNPDIIHSWELMCSVYAMPIAKLIGAKFVNGIIRSAPSNFTFFNNKKWVLFKMTFMFSDVNLSNSYAGLRSFKVSDINNNCIYNGFDFNRIKNINNIEDTKNNHNIKTKNIVGMVARFNKLKNYEMFIESAIQILKKRNEVTFLTVGDGETLHNCMNLVPVEYKENIRFLGKQSDIESIINIFDIGVLLSPTEGISNVIMEYMALGKAVIATKNRGNEEIVINNKTGFLIKPHDINGLTEKIEYLLDNKDIADVMGRYGKERIEKEFSLGKMTDAHIKLYKSML